MSEVNVAGIQALSTIDYPNILSAVIFTQGCNLHCPYCHNPQLITPTSYTQPLSVEDIVDFLTKRRHLLDGLVISGGEPCLQPDLVSFCQQVKELGYKIKLDTNGSRPDVLISLIDHHVVDYIAMDIKTIISDYPLLTSEEHISDSILTSIGILQELDTSSYEFRTTCVEPYVTPSTIKILAGLLEGSNWFLQQCNLSQQMCDAGLTAHTTAERTEMIASANITTSTEHIKIR